MTRFAWLVLLASAAALLLLAPALPRATPAPPRAEPLGFPGAWIDAARTNATLSGVDAVWSREWRLDADAITSTAPFSYVAPSRAVADALASGAAPVRVRLTVDDEGGRLHQMGLVLAPGRAEDARILHRWLATGTLAPREIETTLPARAWGPAWLFVDQGVRVRAIELSLAS